MPPPTDPEYRALLTIRKSLEPLGREAQRRVLRYVSDRMDADIEFAVEHLMANMTEAFIAINQAAAQLGISGHQLCAVVLDMYQRAAEQDGTDSSDHEAKE